jgi:hypothetical protein
MYLAERLGRALKDLVQVGSSTFILIDRPDLV